VVADSLAGRWESVRRSYGGIGERLEFRPGGELLLTPTVMVDARYRVEGDQLVLTMPDSTKVRMTFAIDADRMTRRNGETSQLLRRTTEPALLPLVGTWTYAHHTGQSAFETFHADGRHEFRLPMSEPQRLRYSAAAGHLEIWGSRTHRRTAGLEIALDELVLRLPSDPTPNRYRRQTSP
jgi:hypothetical protein